MSDVQQEVMIPHLKLEAVINVNLGTMFVDRMQKALIYLVEGKEEEIQKLDAKKDTQEPLTPWENAVVGITMLLQEVMKIAESTGQIEYKPIGDFVSIPNSPNQHSDQDR